MRRHKHDTDPSNTGRVKDAAGLHQRGQALVVCRIGGISIVKELEHKGCEESLGALEEGLPEMCRPGAEIGDRCHLCCVN